MRLGNPLGVAIMMILVSGPLVRSPLHSAPPSRVAPNPTVQQAPPESEESNPVTAALAGSYDIGGGNMDFPTLALAVDSLLSDGINAQVTFNVFPGIYADSIHIDEIDGSSASAVVEFVNAVPESVVEITSTGDANGSVVILDGCSFVAFRGISMTAAGDVGQRALRIQQGCTDVTIHGGTIRGSGTAVTESFAVEMLGDPCDRILFDSVRVTGATDGFHLLCGDGSASGNVIRDCMIDSVRTGVYLENQTAFKLERCEISANAGAASDAHGVYIGPLTAGDTVTVCGNRIHGIETSNGRADGVRINTVDNAAVVRVYNNFICGFANTGGSQIRGIDVTSGHNEIYANSILINDAPATGASYAVHHNVINPSVVVYFRNNILANVKQTGTAYALYVQSPIGAIDSDYNIFWGTGGGYVLGRYQFGDRLDLTEWQTATGGDAHSLACDPQFVSETDLHLGQEGECAHQNGTPVSYIDTDIDGDLRDQPPDRGADEYSFTAPPADYALLEILETCTACPELSNVDVVVVVQNRGSEAQTDVPIRVSYLGSPRAETPVSLQPLEIDTTTITWTTGFAPSSGELLVEAILAGDTNLVDNSLTTQISVVGTAMHGTYRIGGQSADYPTFADAISDLTSRGISDSVTFSVSSGTYTEAITIPNPPGSAPDCPVIFRKAIDAEGPVSISSTSGDATILLDGAHHVTFDGIDVEALAPNLVAVLMDNGASGNRIRNATITSSSLSQISANGVRVTGGGCHDNRFSNLTIDNAYFGFRLDGSTASPDSGTLIEDCTILASTRGILALKQRACVIRGNTIHPGYDGLATTCYGIHIASLLEGDTLRVEGNSILGSRGTTTLHAIYSATSAGVSWIVNNMISDWQATGSGTIYGIRVGSGTAEIHFNSIMLNEVAWDGDLTGLAVTGSSALMVVSNNAVDVHDCDTRSCCIYHRNGTVLSDHNVYFCSCASDSCSIARAGISESYSTLSEWIAASNQDSNSLCADPGYRSEIDLHIQSSALVVDSAGVTVPEIWTDFDGDPRGDPPDVGADEYSPWAPPLDYAVQWAGDPGSSFASDSLYAVALLVHNRGTDTPADVPMRLYFNTVQQAETLVTLAPGETDSIYLDWLTPPLDLEGGLLAAQVELPGDQQPANDRAQAQVTIAGPPITGTFQIGGGSADFASLGQAAQTLKLRGVTDTVAIELFPGTYFESVQFDSIPGASALAPVSISPADGDSESVTIRATMGASVLVIAGADYLTFEALQLRALDDCPGAVLLQNGSSRNTFSRCRMIGPDSVDSETFGVRIDGGACDSNTVSRCTIEGAYRGIHLGGGSSAVQSTGNRVGDCTIRHARYGLYVDDQIDAVIESSEIIPGSASTVAAVCYGVFITSLGDGGRVTVRGNRIHGFADNSGNVSNRAVGIYCAPASGGAVDAYNNFIYDFDGVQTLKVTGIYLSVGTNTILHNSIRIGDAPTTNEISGFYLSAGSDHVLVNNIVSCDEPDVPSYGIYAAGGSPARSDYNNLFGSAASFVTGRQSSTDYPTLADWHTTGYDSNSVALDPMFLGSENLHIMHENLEFDNLGDSTSTVPTDIDGQFRNAPPDIGADEFDGFLFPDVPADLTASPTDTSIALRWLPSLHAFRYHVHAGDVPDFIPDAMTWIATVTDTVFEDSDAIPTHGIRFYRVIADSDSLTPH